ncbi:MAG: imidazoleglycerol-phosphate dehydratase HisB [Planctomycetaceae bacterium]
MTVRRLSVGDRTSPAYHLDLCPIMPRTATIQRRTAETDIQLTLTLDGTGRADIATGVGFLDHMLTLFARHGLFDLTVRCQGDTQVDDHHSAEDIGICLGQAFKQALGDKRGIHRYGSMTLPMEETLVTSAVDLSGRFWFVDKFSFPTEKIGAFDCQLVEVFWQALAANALMNLHLVLHHGQNSHHIAEAIFKGTARALRHAVSIDPRETGIPSSKGSL